MLSELYERPELLEPPGAIVTGFLYEDRLTILAGREKCGKSMLMGFLAARCSHFMRVLWLGLEEPLGDAGAPVQALRRRPRQHPDHRQAHRRAR